jgi:hypothetical protein
LVECHEIYTGGIEHEFDGDEHTDEGAALEYPENPETEEQSRYKKIGIETVHDGLLRA